MVQESEKRHENSLSLKFPIEVRGKRKEEMVGVIHDGKHIHGKYAITKKKQ